MRKDMKLLFFASDYQIGLTQANTEVVLGLYRSGKVDMLCASSENELHRKLDEAGVPKCIVGELDVHEGLKLSKGNRTHYRRQRNNPCECAE